MRKNSLSTLRSTRDQSKKHSDDEVSSLTDMIKAAKVREPKKVRRLRKSERTPSYAKIKIVISDDIPLAISSEAINEAFCFENYIENHNLSGYIYGYSERGIGYQTENKDERKELISKFAPTTNDDYTEYLCKVALMSCNGKGNNITDSVNTARPIFRLIDIYTSRTNGCAIYAIHINEYNNETEDIKAPHLHIICNSSRQESLADFIADHL